MVNYGYRFSFFLPLSFFDLPDSDSCLTIAAACTVIFVDVVGESDNDDFLSVSDLDTVLIDDFFDSISNILLDVVGDNDGDFRLHNSLSPIGGEYSSLLCVDAEGLGTGLRSSSVASSADLADHDDDAESDSELRMTIGNGKLHFLVVLPPHDFRISSVE